MFRITRNIFALTCDPKCDRKKERERYTRWEGKKKKYKNIQEKEGLTFFSLSLSARVLGHAVFSTFRCTRGLKFNYGTRTGLITRDSEGFSGPVSHAPNIFPAVQPPPPPPLRRIRHLSRFNDRLEAGITVDR